MPAPTTTYRVTVAEYADRLPDAVSVPPAPPRPAARAARAGAGRPAVARSARGRQYARARPQPAAPGSDGRCARASAGAARVGRLRGVGGRGAVETTQTVGARE